MYTRLTTMTEAAAATARGWWRARRGLDKLCMEISG
jgi:hypothetical protein